MKLRLLFLAFLVPSAFASELGLATVKQPLFLAGDGAGAMLRITDVPYVTRWADPEWRFTAISKPFVPSHDNSWHHPGDVNLASLCKIKVEGTYKANSVDIGVVIDASKASVPDYCPFTLEQVIDAVETCVKLMYPPRPDDEGKLEIKVIRPEKKDAE
ncbi:hypothetical protein HAHE_15300 [Haloferula helveola]|uniref:Uncharacterized protein n=1 Tax=Haloferula helveola TaxID=490095 RepID=A0ABM7RD89_9BACT|nr:hypothetical protein HAHE_15300 [Haloferula helveola]